MTEATGERIVDVLTFEDGEPIARANVEIGLTRNLGNFESLRVSVGVSVPTRLDDLEVAIERSKALAEKYVHRFVEEATQ